MADARPFALKRDPLFVTTQPVSCPGDDSGRVMLRWQPVFGTRYTKVASVEQMGGSLPLPPLHTTEMRVGCDPDPR